MRWDKGANEVRLSGFMQLDSRTYFDDTDDSGQDNFILRRIQPSLEVKLGKIHSFYIMPSFVAESRYSGCLCGKSIKQTL